MPIKRPSFLDDEYDGKRPSSFSSENRMVPYFADDYKERVFLFWYNASKPRPNKLRELLISSGLSNGDGDFPSSDVLVRWKREGRWIEKAAELDEQVIISLKEDAIKERTDMFLRHAEIGSELIERGIEYLQTHEIDGPNTARAIVALGVKIERESRGGAQALARASNMDDETLKRNIRKLMKSLDDSDSRILDGPDDEIVDGELVD